MNGVCGTRVASLHHCCCFGLMPSVCAILAIWSRWPWIAAANSAGMPGLTVCAVAESRADTAGFLVAATTSAPIFSTRSFGNVLIPNRPTRPSTAREAGFPALEVEGRKAGFARGRNVGQDRRALAAIDDDRLDAAGFGL